MNSKNKNEFTIKKNYDDIFLRNIIVSFSYFMYDILEITEVRNNQEIKKKVKCFHSSTGDQQFLTDFYLDNHQYYKEFTGKIEGNYKQIPSGVFTIESSGINNSQLSGGFERMEFVADVETEFGTAQETFSAMTQFYPEEFTVNLEIKASSEAERMKIYDALIEKLYKIRKFYFRYKGFNKIPCHVTFPENPNSDHNFKFRTNANDKLPMLKCSLKLTTSRPIIDETTVMKKMERIEHQTIRRKVNERSQTNVDKDSFV